MISLFLVFLCCVSCSEIHWNETVFITSEDGGIFSLSVDYFYDYEIINSNDFKILPGEALASYKVYEHYRTELLTYNPIKEETRQLQSGGIYSEIFGKEIKFGVFRVGKKNNKEDCITVEEVNNAIKYFDLSLKLLTANRAKVTFTDMYISSQCLEANYNEGHPATFRNGILDNACKVDGECDGKYNSRIYFTDDSVAYPAVKGTASAGHIYNYVRRTTYWALIKWLTKAMDPNSPQVLTTIHELFHNVAFGHANFMKNSVTGLVNKFIFECGLLDSANIMGNKLTWSGIPGITHYVNMLTVLGIEPYFFRTPKSGSKEKFRVFAWDFPYCKKILLDKHADDELIGDIPFDHNGMSVRVPMSKESIYNKMDDPTFVSGSLMLEFRWNPNGQRDWRNRGVRFTPGDVKKSDPLFDFKYDNWRCPVLFDADFENNTSILSTSLPLGVTFYPKEQDVGTFSFRMTKWHPPVNIAVNEESINDETIKPYSDLPYIEVEIEYYPNKPHTFVNQPPPDPLLIFSPNVFNCKNSIQNERKYLICDRLEDFTWSYMISNGLRDVNTPRIYNTDNSNNVMEYYRFGTFGLLNSAYGNYFHLRYGDDNSNIGSLYVKLQKADDPVFYFLYNQNSVLSVVEEDGTETKLLSGNILFVNKLMIGDDLNDFIISDLYDTNIPITIEEGGRILKSMDDLKVQGFSELFLLGRNKDKKTTTGKHFYLYQNDNNDKRVAYEYIETNSNNYDVFNVRPAVIPTGCTTQSGLLQTRHLLANELFIFPILFMATNDYFYIDFSGNIPSGLTVKIETDNGNYTKDLNCFNGLNDISILISFREINDNTGGYGQIYSFTFNKDIDILNIRPVYSWSYSNMPGKQEAGDISIPISATQTYHVVNEEKELLFKFTPFKSVVFGKELSFDTEKQMYEVASKNDIRPTTQKPTTTTPTKEPGPPTKEPTAGPTKTPTAIPTSTAIPTTTISPTANTAIPTTTTTTTNNDSDDDDDDQTNVDKNNSDEEDKKQLLIIIIAASAAAVLIIICCICVCCCRIMKVERACNKGSVTTTKNKPPQPQYPKATYVPRQTMKI